MNKITSLIIFLQSIVCLAQSNPVLVLDNENLLLGKMEDGMVFTGPDQVSFNYSGNTIYIGSERTTDDILFLIYMKSFDSKKPGIVYSSDGRTVQYISRKGSLFLGDYPIDEAYERLLSIEDSEKNGLVVIHGLTGDTLGSIQGEVISNVELVMASYLFITAFDLDKAVIEYKESVLIEQQNSRSGGAIAPAMDPYGWQRWEWDGKILKRRMDLSGAEWRYDGQTISSNMGGIESSWTYQNGILKPTWNNDPSFQYEWKDGIFQPFWDRNTDKMWVLEEGIMRPMWNTDPNLQWQIEGEIPLPLIGMIAVGLIR